MTDIDPNAPVTNAECALHRECIFRRLDDTKEVINKHTDEAIKEHDKNAQQILINDRNIAESVKELVNGYTVMVQEQQRLNAEQVSIKADQICIKQEHNETHEIQKKALSAIGELADFVKPLAQSQVAMQQGITQNQNYLQQTQKENQMFTQKIIIRLIEVGAIVVFVLLGMKIAGISVV